MRRFMNLRNVAEGLGLHGRNVYPPETDHKLALLRQGFFFRANKNADTTRKRKQAKSAMSDHRI